MSCNCCSNCSSDSADSYYPNADGSYDDGASWNIVGRQLSTATIVQCGILLVDCGFRHVHRQWMLERGDAYDILTRWFGHNEHPAKYAKFQGVLYLLQMIASSVTMGTWIWRSYSRQDTNDMVDALEFGSCAYIFALYFYNMIRYGSDTYYIWRPGPLIDVYTCIPIFVRVIGGIDQTWLDFGYLRSFRMLESYSRLLMTGALDSMLSDMQREVVLIVMRTLTLICCFAGTIFAFEVLGNPPNFEDQFISTGMGDISFFQMCYWMFTTISTVGYGDFSPTTILSRGTIVVFIIGGVIFFSVATGHLMEIAESTATGKGRYMRGENANQHVVVVGGACRTRTEVLEAFLGEILHSEHAAASRLEVVLMNTAPMDAEMHALIHEHPYKDQVFYFCGSILDIAGRERIQASQASAVFVLAETGSRNPDQEDCENIVRAVALLRSCPATPLRLMLIRPENRRKAICAGVHAVSCYSMNALKVNMLAQNCRCPGFATLLGNLVSSTHLGTVDHPLAGRTQQDIGSEHASWMLQFLHGDALEVRGFVIKDEFAGSYFFDVALEVFQQHEGVLLIAVQTGSTGDTATATSGLRGSSDDGSEPEAGAVMLFPANYELKEGDICFCLSDSDDSVAGIRKNQEDVRAWHSIYLQRERRLTAKVAPGDDHPGPIRRLSQSEGYEVEDNRVQPILPESRSGRLAGGDASMPNSPVSGGEHGRTVGLPLMQFAGVHSASHVMHEVINEEFSGIDEVSHESDMAMMAQQAFVDTAEMLKMGEGIARRGGHIMLLGMSLNLWQVVVAFLRPLRAEYLPVHTPVVVIVAQPAPLELATLFPDVAFVCRDATNLKSMVTLGLQQAARVVVVGGKADPGQERKMADAKMLLAACTLEAYLEATHSPIHTAERACVYELTSEQNIMLLPEVAPPSALIEASGMDPLKYHWRSLNGSVMAATNLACLFAWSFYTPGIMSIFCSMVVPAQRQQLVQPWRVRLPAWLAGRSYSELMRLFLAGQLLADAYDTEPMTAPTPGLPHNKALPLGLFRPRGAHGAALGYVMTNPPACTVLMEGDCVFVLASKEFGAQFVSMLK